MVAQRQSISPPAVVVIPNGFAMLRESVPLNRLGRSSGTIGSVMSIAAATGPILGAALLALWSWRLLFLMNVPLVLGALLTLQLLQCPKLFVGDGFS